jgi:hypothetical protein
VIGLFAVGVFGWTALQSAAGPEEVEKTSGPAAPASRRPAGTSEPKTDPEETLVLEEDVPPPDTATGEQTLQAPTLAPPAKTMPVNNHAPLPAPGPATRRIGS